MTNSKMETPTTDPGDVAAWKALVLWARKHGVAIHELSVGSVRGVITDTARAQPTEKSDKETRDGLYAHYGGQLLDSAIMETEKDEDDEEED